MRLIAGMPPAVWYAVGGFIALMAGSMLIRAAVRGHRVEADRRADRLVEAYYAKWRRDNAR